MAGRSLRCCVALALLLLAAPSHGQSVGSFDDAGSSGAPRTPSQAGYPSASPPGAQPQRQTNYPAAPAPAVPQRAPGQAGYGGSYQQPATAKSTYLLSPPVLPYREGIDPPQGYVLEKHRNRGLMIGGGLTFSGAYAIGLGYALSKSFDNGTGWLAVPIIGPWAAIKGRSFECKSDNNVSQEDVDKCVDGALNEVTAITFLAVTGIVQAVGATLFFIGVGDITREWVRADLATVEVEADVGSVSDGYGFTLNARF